MRYATGNVKHNFVDMTVSYALLTLGEFGHVFADILAILAVSTKHAANILKVKLIGHSTFQHLELQH
eukprot:3931403-Pleurochrysis_carterae.AAC.1